MQTRHIEKIQIDSPNCTIKCLDVEHLLPRLQPSRPYINSWPCTLPGSRPAHPSRRARFAKREVRTCNRVTSARPEVWGLGNSRTQKELRRRRLIVVKHLSLEQLSCSAKHSCTWDMQLPVSFICHVRIDSDSPRGVANGNAIIPRPSNGVYK